MILLYMAASALVGFAVGAAAGRFAGIAGALMTLVGVAPVAVLYAYDNLVGFEGDPSGVSMLATLASVLVLPAGLAALATAFFTRG